jgi:hypothetical protein
MADTMRTSWEDDRLRFSYATAVDLEARAERSAAG